MGGARALQPSIVGEKSLFTYFLEPVTYDELLESLSQDFLIF